MVTVAKSFDAPIKLVFPRNIFAEEFKFSMLGLGDIVIPGVFVALLLRFDRSLKKKLKGRTPFFNMCFMSYVLGLVTTIFVMHYFKHAQPALLYLVPYTLLSSLLTAVLYGEFSAMWNYSEEKEEKKDEHNKKEQ